MLDDARGGAGVRPVRLRLSRARGFDLQAHSRSVNGLEAVNCARPGFWGNPFTVTDRMSPGASCGGSRLHGYLAVPTTEDAVACFEEMMTLPAGPGQRAHELRAALPNIAGHNLACWCPLPGEGEADCCHAAVLLRLANQASTDAGAPAAEGRDGGGGGGAI